MRKLEVATLDQAAIDYAGMFLMPSKRTPSDKAWFTGPEKVMQDFFAFHFKDEFDYMFQAIREQLGKQARDRFDDMANRHFTPRSDKEFKRQLRERLAIDEKGEHIEGEIGCVEIGRRVVGRKLIVRRRPICRPVDKGHPEGAWEIVGYQEYPAMIRDEWPIYMGEGEERAAGRVKGSSVMSRLGFPDKGADPLPDGAEPLAVGANVTNFSEECIRFALDGIAGRLDEGSTAATIRGRTGAQPADPDAAETGTLLFTLTCSATAVNAAVDDADGTCSATFAAITDDSSADATNTLGYCRFGATGTGADDHIDGNATTDGTGATDWNTLSIVSGSTVSMTSAVLGMSQGSTAT